MEDSFRVRVDRTFNSLSSTSSSSSSSSQTVSSSLWSLTDDEIQKRQWIRESDASLAVEDDENDEIDGVTPSSIDKFFFAANDKLNPNPNPNPNPNCELNGSDCVTELKDDLKELDDGGTGDEIGEKSSVRRCRDEDGEEEDELEVRNSIGMDCTLDFEEEEDEYDKVAVGREKAGDRLFMSDVTDYTSHLNSYNELPDTFGEVSRDPRANHLAAKLRLKEDAETARSFNSLHVSDQPEDDVSGAQNNAPEDGSLPKSILKRKDDQMESKLGKRVRFESTCKTDDHNASEADKIVVSEATNVDYSSFREPSSGQHNSSLVPDYIRHPLRYTHYSFDSSSDMNEESNRQAYTDFLSMVKKSKSDPEEVPADLTKPVIFNPKKKASDASIITSAKTDQTKEVTMEEPVQKKSLPLRIAAINTEEDQASEMEVDEQENAAVKAGNGNRTVRKYRSKLTLESNKGD